MITKIVLNGLKITLLSIFCLVLNFNLMAQSAIEVKGTVTDTDGVSLPGVSVVHEGTTYGTVTDLNGNYQLTVPSDAVLRFSFIGMITQQVPVAGKSIINFTMEADAISLDEFVVVGYGSQRKSDLTGSVSSISSSRLRENPIARIEDGLQGKIAGVRIQSTDGAPGQGAKVRIRGGSSISFSNDPLYVIDGFIGANISTVNPADIETIDILKDASATAVYGSRGANGVVIITTTRPVAGDMKVSFTRSRNYS